MGPVDILNLLLVDHTRQRGLIRSILNTALDSRERLELFDELSAELAAHAAAEEQTLFAELLTDSREQIQRSVASNDKIAELALRLRELGDGSPEWLETFADLRTEIESHLQFEETEIFPRVRRVIKRDKARRLARSFVKMKLRELCLDGVCPVGRRPAPALEQSAACISVNQRRKPGLASSSQAGGRSLRSRLGDGLPREKRG